MAKKMKRSLALLLALVMCLGMLPMSVFAAEAITHEHNQDGWVCTQVTEDTRTLVCDRHVHDESCYTTERGELTCEAEEHEHSDDCYAVARGELTCEITEHTHTEDCRDEDGELICGLEAHTHGDDCYAAARGELTCTETEHTHGDGCYEVVTEKTCGEEDHEHGDECYEVVPGEWSCTAPVEKTPAEVTAFLSAVAAIRVPEEDLVLAENAELAEAFSAEIWAAYALWEELSEEQQALEEVDISFLELQNMLTVLPDYGTSDYALSNVVVRPDYNPGSCVPGVSKFGGSISKAVGETGFYQRRAVQDFVCTGCGWYYGRSDAKEYANFEVVGENLDVISNISYEVGNLQGYPCLQMNFTGAKAGTAKVTLRYDVNFHTRWNSSYAACPSCGAMTPVLQYDDNWYHYEDTFYVTVESPKHEDQVWYVYVPTNGIENGSATIELNAILPAKSIYYYNYGYVWNKYNAYMPVRNASLSDPNGVQGNYANVTWEYTRHKDWVGAPSYDYGINLTVTGLDTPTPDGKPISVFLNYEWPYSCKLVNANDLYMYYSMQWGNTVKSEIRIVVYEPETVTIKAGEANKYTHNYGDEMTGKSVEALTWGPYVRTLDEAKASANRPTLSTKNVVGLNYTIKAELTAGGNYDYYNVYGLESGIGKTTKVSTTYTYFGNYVGGGSNYLFIYPRTTYVDVVNYKVVADDETTTPVTIVKEFDGLTEDQIPDSFTLQYTITGCSEHKTTSAVTLNKADATVTNANGTPSLVWNVDLPAVKHGDVTHTITFTESNASVRGFTGPTMTGSTVTLESLTAEDGAKPVIAVTNRYEPDKTMYVLSYDGMGGTNCPATQYTNIGSTDSHTFDVKGAETEIKVPVNPGYTFKGWSETDTNQTVVYAYNSETRTYAPATITLTKDAPSKTLYAVWEKTTTPTNPSLTKLEKVRVTDETQAPAGTPADVEYGAVIFRSDTQKVKLLYKLTVTGTAGAQYKVTDEGAEWVSGGDSHSKDDNTLVITGTIAEGETTAVIYVTREFSAADIQNNTLTNNAELVSNGTTENPTDGPSGDNGKDGDDSDASEKRNVTINFKTDGGETLQDSTSKDYDKGGNFSGISIPDKPTTRKAAPRAAAETIVIPWTIEKDGKTYVLDEVASAQALEDLKNLTTVTENVVKDIIYSLDMKGGNDSTRDEGGPDGTPDKYQAKVVYTATAGGTQDGMNTYATIMNNGKMATEGTISIAGATATANSGYYFENWTAAATGHNGWNYGPSTAAALAGFDIGNAKGGAVYTFTANFQAKTALTVEIVGNTNTVTYNGNEQSVTGYTVKTDLPANVSVELATGKTAEAKGTAVGGYDMGLKQDSFVLTGDDAYKYTVTFTVTDGWLKINPRDTALSVSAGNVETTYDGEGHTVTPVVTFNGQEVTDLDANGITVTVTYTKEDGTVITGEPTDAGTYTANITAQKAGEKDATGTATVTINKATLTVTTDSASKVYDGNPLTALGSISGLVGKETVTFAVTGSQTEVGSSSNTYTLTWNGTAKKDNYTVTEQLGTLTVTTPVIVIPDPVDTTYTLSYDANGGEGAPASQSQLNSNVFTVSGGEPTREGYTFQGWATTPDGAVSYRAGSSITITGLSQTLYAVWQEDEEDITDENPPLTDLPDTGDDKPDVDLPKDPTEDLPDEEEISDGDVPLTDVPKTGDHTNRFLVMAAVSGLCLLTLLSGRRKEDEA